MAKFEVNPLHIEEANPKECHESRPSAFLVAYSVVVSLLAVILLVLSTFLFLTQRAEIDDREVDITWQPTTEETFEVDGQQFKQRMTTDDQRTVVVFTQLKLNATVVIDYKREMLAVHLPFANKCLLTGGLRNRAVIIEPSQIDSVPATDHSIVPRALRSECADKEVSWIQPSHDDGDEVEGAEERMGRGMREKRSTGSKKAKESGEKICIVWSRCGVFDVGMCRPEKLCYIK